MNPNTFNRLHALRQDNDAARFAQMEMRPRFDRLAGRHENGTAPRAVSAFQLFQTPPALAARLCGNLALANGAAILEPSAGLGRLLDAIRAQCPTAEAVAVEMAPQLAAELYRQERPGVKLLQRDFLTMSRADLLPADAAGFDAVAMNPPFHLRADIAHILHARQFLKPGGRLAALCLHTRHRETALRPLAASWEIIPAGTFRAEGTQVETVLLTIQN